MSLELLPYAIMFFVFDVNPTTDLELRITAAATVCSRMYQINTLTILSIKICYLIVLSYFQHDLSLIG